MNIAPLRLLLHRAGKAWRKTTSLGDKIMKVGVVFLLLAGLGLPVLLLGVLFGSDAMLTIGFKMFLGGVAVYCAAFFLWLTAEVWQN